MDEVKFEKKPPMFAVARYDESFLSFSDYPFALISVPEEQLADFAGADQNSLYFFLKLSTNVDAMSVIDWAEEVETTEEVVEDEELVVDESA